MAKGERRGSGGTRKHGRNKETCARYRTEHRKEKNKMIRLSAMIKRLDPNNNMRKECEKRIEELQLGW